MDAHLKHTHASSENAQTWRAHGRRQALPVSVRAVVRGCRLRALQPAATSGTRPRVRVSPTPQFDTFPASTRRAHLHEAVNICSASAAMRFLGCRLHVVATERENGGCFARSCSCGRRTAEPPSRRARMLQLEAGACCVVNAINAAKEPTWSLSAHENALVE